MAFQTTTGILTRLQTVLEAAPCSLVPSPNPFTVDAVPNALVNTTYRVRTAGIVHEQSMTNYAVARLERFEVLVQRTLDFDGYDAIETLQTLLDTITRAVIADGPANSYAVHVEKGSRKVTRPKGTDLAEAVVNFLVDYDYTETA